MSGLYHWYGRRYQQAEVTPSHRVRHSDKTADNMVSNLLLNRSAVSLVELMADAQERVFPREFFQKSGCINTWKRSLVVLRERLAWTQYIYARKQAVVGCFSDDRGESSIASWVGFLCWGMYRVWDYFHEYCKH